MFENLKQKFKQTVKRMTHSEFTPEDIENITQDLRISLLENDVAVSVADRIIESLEEEFTGKKLGIRDNPQEHAEEALKEIVEDVLSPGERVDLLEIVEEGKRLDRPAIFVFVGINGCGKTTTIAKLSEYLLNHDYEPVLAAADTFRAAGIEQLQKHGDKIGVRVIKQERGSDAAAVAYDAIEHGRALGKDAVLVDTAGRMQTDVNLMAEMEKICRVATPDLTIFVGDALTGNDAVEQASKFDEAVGIDGSVLAKMDADAKGGAALSIAHITGKPILFLGTGQDYDDLVRFEPEVIVNSLFPE